MNSNRPLVSVCMVTYNHEQYINEAVHSVLNQTADFNYEIIIGEDCSTDRTKTLLIKLKKENPNKIKLLLNAKNKGMIPNFTNVLKHARGKYIALLDGDDYWTDALKLQKQVDFLENNKDVNIVHTDFDWLDFETGNIIKNYYKKNDIKFKEIYDIKEWYLNPKGRSLTFCFRRLALAGFAEIIDHGWTVGDTALILHLIKNKNIGYIDFSTGIYRRNLGSASTLNNSIERLRYVENGSTKVKDFFYNHYKLNDDKIKKKIRDDYYDAVMKLALPAGKYSLFLTSILYKINKKKLSKSNIKYLVILIFNIVKNFLCTGQKSNFII